MKRLLALALMHCWSFAFAVNLPFELPWMNAQVAGTTYSTSDHSDGIFVVEAYFLNCPYCNYNAENVNRLASRFRENMRVQVLDVGVDRSDSQYVEWINRHRPNHPVLKDASRKLINQLGVEGFPSTYVLDCRGNIVAWTEGQWGPEEEETIYSAIEKLQHSSCTPN